MDLLVPISSIKRYPRLPDGTYLAILYRIIEKGTQAERYTANWKSSSKRILFSWVLPEYEDKNGKQYRPVTIHKEYRMYLTEQAHLYKDIECMRGIPFSNYEKENQFDILSLLGLPCYLTIKSQSSNDSIKHYWELSKIAPLLDESLFIPDSPLEYQALTFQYWNWSLYNRLSHQLQEDIRRSPEFQLLIPQEPSNQ